MSLYTRLERTFSPWVPHHFLMVLLIGQVMVYFMIQTGQILPEQLVLTGFHLRQGEFWRLITFMVYPMRMEPLWFAIGISITWMMGTALENHWGPFRFFLYILCGWAATVLACWLVPLAVGTNFYLNAAFTLAFARYYPDMEFRLFFAIPLKAKYFALIIWVTFALAAVTGHPLQRVILLAALTPHFLFFGKDMLGDLRSGRRRRAFKKETHSTSRSATHVCSVCGKTNITDPAIDFRYRNGLCVCESCLTEGK